MSVQIFQFNTRGNKHESVSVDGLCYRFDRAFVQTYQKRFRCCDQSCNARVLFNSLSDFKLVGNHTNCTFDHHREFQSRKRRDMALNLLKLNMTESPQQIVDRVSERMKLAAAEKSSLKMFVVRKRNELLDVQDVGSDVLVIPPTLRVTLTPQTVDHPDNSFLMFDNVDDEEATARIIVFASSDMKFKASRATELFADGTYKVVPKKVCNTLHHSHPRRRRPPPNLFLSPRERTRRNVHEAFERYQTQSLSIWRRLRRTHGLSEERNERISTYVPL